MTAGDRAAGEDDGESVMFADCFWPILEEATRRKLGKSSYWHPQHREIAEAIDASAAAVSRWRSGKSLPRENRVKLALDLAGVTGRTKIEVLGQYRKAVDRRNSRKTDPDQVVDQQYTAEGDIASESVQRSANTDRPAVDLRNAQGAQIGDHNVQVMAVEIPQRDERADPITRAADALAKHIREQWAPAAAERGLDLPPPISPCWSLTRLPVAGSLDVAIGTPDRQPRFPPLHGVAPATVDSLRCGELRELFAAYAGLNSGRIVVMGHYGSGKTAAAILLLLEALAHRAGLPPDARARTPVPVLLTARDWDPRIHTLADWFTGQLDTLHRFLRSAQFGPHAAAELVRDGRVALFLDGFDEMDAELQALALRHINQQHQAFRLLLLARIDDFVHVVASERLHLHGAVALELLPVSSDQGVAYLDSYRRSSDDEQLQRLTDHMKRHPDDPVSQALDRPLILSLINDDPNAVGQLLDPGRFESRDQVESFLLGRVVPAAYDPDLQPGSGSDAAERQFGYLATKMNGNDLSWWRMHHWAPAWERHLFNTMTGAILVSGASSVLFSPVGQYSVTGNTGTLFGAVYGAAMGALFGFIAGVVSDLRYPSPRPEKQAGRTSDRSRSRFARLRQIDFNPAIGLFIFALVTMAVGNQAGYQFSPLAGVLAAGIAGNAATRIRVLSERRSLWKRFCPNATDILAALFIGLPIALAYGITRTPIWGAAAGLITAFTFGFMVSMARPLADTGIAPNPGTRWTQDIQQTLLVGFSAGIPIGVALGLQHGISHGLPEGIIALVAHATIISLGCMVGVSDAWRTTLLFIQLRIRGVFPVLGMRFLIDAQERRVLRTNGPYFQFRHDRLRAALAEAYKNRPPKATLALRTDDAIAQCSERPAPPPARDA